MTTNNIPHRWYMITKDGAATLCVDEYDAMQNVIDADVLYPNNAPHTAVQLAPVQPAMPADAYPCRIVEADFETGTVTLQMEGKYTVSAGPKPLCDRRRIEGE